MLLVWFAIIAFSIFLFHFRASPALAAAKKVAAGAAVTKKRSTLLQKILQGVNASGRTSNLKAGDSKNEIAAIVNAVSSLVIMSALTVVGYVCHVVGNIQWQSTHKKELERVKEYKEVTQRTLYMHPFLFVILDRILILYIQTYVFLLHSSLYYARTCTSKQYKKS